MATSVQAFIATITAGTAKATPMTVNLPVMQGFIDAIKWRVPSGPRGNLGWVLAMGGVQVIPENTGTYIVADDDTDTVQIAGLPDSGAWQVIGYNTGSFDHSIYLDFHVTPVSLANQAPDILTGFPTSDADIPTMWMS